MTSSPCSSATAFLSESRSNLTGRGWHRPDGDGVIRLWETDAFTPVGELHGHNGYVLRMVWTREEPMEGPASQSSGKLLSCGEDGTVRIWGVHDEATRAHDIRLRQQLVTELTPRVRSLFAELGDADAVVDHIESDETLTPRERQVGLQLVLALSLARSGDG